MPHPASNQLVSVQQIVNAIYAVSGFVVPSINTAEAGYIYQTISTSAQTLVKTGAGILGKIALQSTLVSALKVYDNVVSGGNVIAYIPALTSAGSVFSYQTRFVSGMVVSSGAGADVFNVIFN